MATLLSGFLDNKCTVKGSIKPLCVNSLKEKNVEIQAAGNARDDLTGAKGEVKAATYSLQALVTWTGTVYLQSMIIVRVSLSLVSWKGG